jgi:hypothetical protein
MARAEEMLAGEKNRLPSRRPSRPYRSKASLLTESATLRVSAVISPRGTIFVKASGGIHPFTPSLVRKLINPSSTTITGVLTFSFPLGAPTTMLA